MKKIAAFLIVFLVLSAPAFASLTDANVVKGHPSFSAGFSILQGFGFVGTASFPIDGRMELGSSIGYSFDSPNPYLADLHMNFQFTEPSAKSPLCFSLVGGVWGGTSSGIWLSKQSREFYIQPELGVCMTYLVDSRLTWRFNFVYGPSLGLELGYKITPALEGVFAISEQVIGIKFRF